MSLQEIIEKTQWPNPGRPIVEMTFAAEKHSGPEFSSGGTYFRYTQCHVTDDEGNEIGSVCGADTGGVIIHDTSRGEEWYIPPDMIWYVYQEMREAQDG